MTNIYIIFRMRVALAQMNPTLGDLTLNLQKMLKMTEQALEKNCQLIVFPELSLLGYNPTDLLEREEVVKKQALMVKAFCEQKPKGIQAIFGAVTVNTHKLHKQYFNSAVYTGQKITKIHKSLLPSYDVFDDTRFFAAGDMKNHVLKIGKKKVLVLICEDMWAWEKKHYINPLLSLKKEIDLVISINASPFALSKSKRRLDIAKKTAKHFSAPVIYVNMVGGQDELIFDGGSFALNAKGKKIAQSAFFTEDLNVVDLQTELGGFRTAQESTIERIYSSIVLGLRDFVHKNGFQKIHLGLSGGIDSAVALALAADAVGPKNVTGIAMPGPFSDPLSYKLAQSLVKNIGCDFLKIDIQSSYQQLLLEYQKAVGPFEFGLVNENLQARLRGNFLMMYSNQHKSLLLATGNKSEFATGYSTLYGDMCGGLAPLGDLLKNQVYALAEFYNQQYELIPQGIISRAPSAELRPNQKDQDSLPPYDQLDKAVDKLITHQQKAKGKVENWLLKKIANSEFKRWQAPPILRVSEHSFGRGRRLPITNGFYK